MNKPGTAHTISLAACLFLAACAPQEKIPTLKEGFAQYNARQVEQSEASADKIIAADPQAPTVDEAYYLRGLSRMTRGNHIGAAADFQTAISKTVRPDLKAKAWRALGDIAFDQIQWADAQKDYESALAAGAATPANSASANYLNYRIGACQQAQGDWTRAAASFGRVIAADNDPAQKEIKDRALARMHATNYSLQFGAFVDAAKARELVAQLKAAGLAAVIPVDVREGQVLYLVQSGSYHTMNQAAKARDALSARYPLVTIVP